MPAFPSNLKAWGDRIPLTINGSLIDTNLTDFPVLVKLNSTRFDFSKARSDGYDIRFALPDGTLLKYERERHDAINQVAEYWVKIPSILTGTNKIFYLYYGNPNATDGADPTNVWDSYFSCVHHLRDYTSSQVNDSTINALNGVKTAANEPIEVDAKIGKGQSFDGSNDKINLGNYTPLNFGTGSFTLEAWIKLSALNLDQIIVGKRWIIGDYEQYIFVVNSNNKLQLWTYGSGFGNESSIISNSVLTTDTWYYVVAVRDASSTYHRLYINGVEDASAQLPVRNVTSDGNNWIGADNRDNIKYFHGIIDEVRQSKGIARSAAWIKASYNSGNDTLLSYGSEELPPAFLLFFN